MYHIIFMIFYQFDEVLQFQNKIKYKAHKMGTCFTKDNQYITNILLVGSLNYSGVITSPYQYYEKSNYDDKGLSDIFTRLVKEKYPNFDPVDKKNQFKWEMGTIDNIWKKRFSPVNNQNVGLIQSQKRLMSQKQFSAEWEKVHSKTFDWLADNYLVQKQKDKSKRIQMIKPQVERAREFDLFCYKALVQWIYGKENANKILEYSKNQDKAIDSKLYFQQKKKHFSKPFLNRQAKLNNSINAFHQLQYDVYFVQQVDNDFKKKLQHGKKYHVKQGKTGLSSAIAFKLSTFGTNFIEESQKENNLFFYNYAKFWRRYEKDITPEKLKQRLDFNKDSVCQYYKGYFFINAHLTSKVQTNQSQLQQMKKQIGNVLNFMPSLRLICGGDLNTDLSKDGALNFQIKSQTIDKQLSIYPNDPNIKTVMKMRTMMQPQRNKAKKLDQSIKDYLISNGKMTDQKCMLINQLDVTQKMINKGQKSLPLLPNQIHPYDHFLISSKIQFPS